MISFLEWGSLEVNFHDDTLCYDTTAILLHFRALLLEKGVFVMWAWPAIGNVENCEYIWLSLLRLCKVTLETALFPSSKHWAGILSLYGRSHLAARASSKSPVLLLALKHRGFLCRRSSPRTCVPLYTSFRLQVSLLESGNKKKKEKIAAEFKNS